MSEPTRWRPVGSTGTFCKWETPGQELEGTWEGQHDGQFGPLGAIQTPEGRVRFPLHTALLERLKLVQEGAEVLIRYRGKETSKAGRVFKAFDVFVASADAVLDEPAEDGNDVPF